MKTPVLTLWDILFSIVNNWGKSSNDRHFAWFKYPVRVVSARFVKVCGVWRDIKYRRHLNARKITYFTCSGYLLLCVLEVLCLLVLVDCCLLVKSWSSKYERKKRENPSEIEKNFMKMRCCVTPCGQTDVLAHHKKHFLPFRVLLNVGIDPNLLLKTFCFSFLALFREKFRFSAKTFLF